MLNDKVSRARAAKTTQFAARKGSSFLYFVYDRDASTLAGYTKAGTVLNAVITRATLSYFLEADLKLRGQAFGEIVKSYSKGLAVRKLTSDEYITALVRVKREVVLPARKNGHFDSFKVRALKSDAKFTVIGALKGPSKTKLVAVLDRKQMAKFAITPLGQRGKAFAALVRQSGN